MADEKRYLVDEKYLLMLDRCHIIDETILFDSFQILLYEITILRDEFER
jgi:hypothetical protein